MDKWNRTWFLILSILVIAACFGVGYLFVLQGQQQNVGDLPLGSGFNPVYFDWASKKLIVESGGELEVQTGGVIDAQSGSTTNFAGTQTFDDLTVGDDAVIVDDLNVKDVVVTTTLTLGGVFSNLRYGMAATVTDGVTITHGLGGAPLFVMLEPYGDGITVAVSVVISDATSFTVNVPDGVTVANMGWFAGK